MTVVNSKEFVTNQKKYFNLAVNEDIFIKRGKNRFRLVYTNVDNTSEYDEILEPDEDFYKAISAEEFKKRALEIVEKVHNRYYNK